jgi:ABC-type multidrug transport system fused ATPase/permease subunit
MNRIQGFIVFIKRFPNVGPILLLILLAGIAEGVGLSLLVPLASSLTNGSVKDSNVSMPFNLLNEGFTMVGIEPTFGATLLVLTIVMLTSFLLIHLQDRVLFSARYRFLEMLRNRASDTIFAAKWEHISSLSSGEVTNKIINEAERGTEALIASMAMVVILIQLLVYGVFAFILSWQMFFIALGALLIASLLVRRLIRAVRIMGSRNAEINTLYSRQLVDFVRGAKLIKATAIGQVIAEKLHDASSESCRVNCGIVVNQSLMRFELQSIISVVMVTILYTAIEVFKIPVSILLVFLFVLLRLTPKFSSFQAQWHNYSAFYPALEIVDNMIGECEAMSERRCVNEISFDNLADRLYLESVSYRYPKVNNDALSNVSMTIRSKEFIAIVGRSGSGKTTLLDLIMGLIEPSKGRFYLDGFEVTELNKEAYWQRIGYVPQESVFFNGTILDNLCMGINFEEQHVWHCLEIAQIDKLIHSLKNGLNTEVGESGVRLSGGQRQRLSIARALVRRPTLLILDEATSALDSESEVAFQKAIDSIALQYTIILVAHRLSTVRNADRIYVMGEGSILEEGDYDSLRDRGGEFTKLLSAQMIH